MTLSKKYLKRIVKEAVLSALNTPESPDQPMRTAHSKYSHRHNGSNEESKEALTHVQPALSATNQPPTPGRPTGGHHRHGSNAEGLPSDEEDLFWEIEKTPEKEDDEEIYCARFDEMAEAHIEDLTEGLNDQLDNLLLFAALFSGINSAFIVFSLPNLGDPVAETNQLISILIGTQNNASAAYMAQVVLDSQNSPPSLNVVVNILFASSLICSLITAFFAVVGKQWLSYLAEESSDGDEHTRRTKMQNKVIGIQRYRLQALLDAYLTTTIQIALFLFMAGLVLFLYTFNSLVTWFVVAFAGAGMLTYIVSAALALRDPACPFQTPVTRTILPWLFSRSFNATYPLWILLSSVIIVLGNMFKELPICRAQMRDGLSEPGDKDVKEVFEIQWDHRYATRRKLAESLQSIPTAERVDTEAACWMIRTAENEMAARVAALKLLAVTASDELTFVATHPDTTRRLREIISVSDKVLKEEEQVAAHIKDREWKKLCFYVQALSHVFAGHRAVDATQCQVMDWIYQYQKNRKRGKDHHGYTCVPARMVGVIKLLLLHLDGKHYSKMKPERTEVLQHRLYQTPFEAKCSSKALSLVAFAMKALPRIASTDRDQTTCQQLQDDLWRSYIKNDLDVLHSNFASVIATYADLIQSRKARDFLPSARQLQTLWKRITTKEQPGAHDPTDIAPTTVIDATKQVYPTVPAILISPPVSDPFLNLYAMQLQQLAQGRTAGSHATEIAPATVPDATKRVPPPITVVRASPPVSDPSLNCGTIQPQQSGESLAADSNVLAEWKAENKACLAEACLNLARRCSYGLPLDGRFEKNAVHQIHQIVRDIWAACYEDVVRSSSGKPSSTPEGTIHHTRTATPLSETEDPGSAKRLVESVTKDQSGESSPSTEEIVHHLRMATALLEAADSDLRNHLLASITDEQRKTLRENGLQWIKVATAKLKDKVLTKNLFFTSPEAKRAIGYFLQHLADGDPLGSEEECDFAERYLSICWSKGPEAFASVLGLNEAVTRWREALSSTSIKKEGTDLDTYIIPTL